MSSSNGFCTFKTYNLKVREMKSVKKGKHSRKANYFFNPKSGVSAVSLFPIWEKIKNQRCMRNGRTMWRVSKQKKFVSMAEILRRIERNQKVFLCRDAQKLPKRAWYYAKYNVASSKRSSSVYNGNFILPDRSRRKNKNCTNIKCSEFPKVQEFNGYQPELNHASITENFDNDNSLLYTTAEIAKKNDISLSGLWQGLHNKSSVSTSDSILEEVYFETEKSDAFMTEGDICMSSEQMESHSNISETCNLVDQSNKGNYHEVYNSSMKQSCYMENRDQERRHSDSSLKQSRMSDVMSCNSLPSTDYRSSDEEVVEVPAFEISSDSSSKLKVEAQQNSKDELLFPNFSNSNLPLHLSDRNSLEQCNQISEVHCISSSSEISNSDAASCSGETSNTNSSDSECSISCDEGITVLKVIEPVKKPEKIVEISSESDSDDISGGNEPERGNRRYESGFSSYKTFCDLKETAKQLGNVSKVKKSRSGGNKCPETKKQHFEIAINNNSKKQITNNVPKSTSNESAYSVPSCSYFCIDSDDSSVLSNDSNTETTLMMNHENPLNIDNMARRCINLQECLNRVKMRLKESQNAKELEFSTNIPLSELEDKLGFRPSYLHLAGLRVSKERQKELEASGVTIKKGKFSESEDALLLDNLQNFMDKHNIQNPQVLVDVNLKEDVATKLFLHANHFFEHLAKNLDNRILYSVYRRARKLFDIDRRISSLENRFQMLESDVRSRINMQQRKATSTKRHSIVWTDTEIDLLQQAVEDIVSDKDKAMAYQNTLWNEIAQLISTKTAKQCRKRWFEYHSFNFFRGKKEKWTEQESACLIYLIHLELQNQRKSIDWDYLYDLFRNHVSSSIGIKEQWNSLRQTIPSHKAKDDYKSVCYLYKHHLPQLLENLNLQLSDLSSLIKVTYP